MKTIKYGSLLVCITLCLQANADCTSNRNLQIPISKPDTIYLDHGDGTVTDNETGLMWQKCTLGLTGATCATGAATTYTWEGALAAANADTLAGYANWRLPNAKELNSLADLACHTPAINNAIFPNTPSGGVVYLWSSTTYSVNNQQAIIFTMTNGTDWFLNKNELHNARLVRTP